MFLIPAYVITLLALINAVLLILRIHKTHSWTAVALLVPMISLFCIYIVIDNFDLPTSQIYGRWGFVILLTCQAVVSAAYVKYSGGKKNGN